MITRTGITIEFRVAASDSHLLHREARKEQSASPTRLNIGRSKPATTSPFTTPNFFFFNIHTIFGMSASRSICVVRRLRYPLSLRLNTALGSRTTCFTAKTFDRKYASKHTPRQDQHDFRGPPSDPEELDEQFYNYYLSGFKIRDQKIVPSKWTEFINAGPSLSPELQRDPLSVLDTDTEDLDLVRRCLEHFVALTKQESTSKQDERDRYAQAKAGGRTLLWLISGDRFHKFDLGLNPQFTRIVVHCIAAEQGVDFLWTWVSVDEVPSFAASWRLSEQNSWRGTVLRALMESTTYWADDITQGLETALEHYQHAIALCKERRMRNGSEPPFIPLYPAGIWLSKQLCCYSQHQVSLSSIQKFAHTCGVWCSDRDQRRYNQAKLVLESNPFEACSFFRYCDSTTEPSLFVQDILNPRDRNSAYDTSLSIVRTAQALQKAGALTDAKSLLEIGRRRLPDLFGHRRYDHATERGSDLQMFRTTATPFQIAEGVAVDQCGRPVISERRRELHKVFLKLNAEERRQSEILRSRKS